MPIKILSVVGARPNFMKVAPILRAIGEHNARAAGTARTIEHVLVHTGQHYDESMSGSFFADLGLPKPDVHLEVGSASHAVQTAEIMRRFEEVVIREKPHAVLVVGDVNSTVACAIVTAKLSFDTAGTRPLIVHVEAGLRSFDRTMPEECNRILTDHLSDLMFITEQSGIINLRKEGISSKKFWLVGNTMIDSLLSYQQKADASGALERLGLRTATSAGSNSVAPYALLTLHRPSNVDARASFENILRGLQSVTSQMPVVFPVHPRTRKRIEEFGLGHYFDIAEPAAGGQPIQPAKNKVSLVPPLGYLDFLCVMKNARLVVTDSGGVQEETTCLGIPCVTVRENTERPITVTSGTNVLAGASEKRIRAAVRSQIRKKVRPRTPKFWDGKAAPRIVKILAQECARRFKI